MTIKKAYLIGILLYAVPHVLNGMISPSYPLHAAALQGDIKTVNELLAQGSDPNKRDDQGSTSLHEAAAAPKNSLEIAKLLIDKGALINAQDKLGYTPLHEAIYTNNIPTIQLLLDKGANPALKHKLDAAEKAAINTALHAAVISTSPKIVKMILDTGIDPDIGKDVQIPEIVDLLTPLYLAVSLFDETNKPIIPKEIPKLLIQYGADPNRKNQRGKTYLISTVELIRIPHFPYYVQALLENGADPNLQDRSGLSALHHAARKKFPEIVALLLNFKANPNLPTKKGNTPLHTIMSTSKFTPQDQEIINALLRHGANVKATNTDGRTLLHTAALANALEKVKMLIDFMRRTGNLAVVNMQDRADGLYNTALHYAAVHANPQMIMALIQAGADVNERNTSRETPLNIVLQAASTAPVHDVEESAHLLLDAGATNIADDTRTTPLHRAAEIPRLISIVKKLIEKGAHVNLQDNMLESALHKAVRRDAYDIAQLLVRNKVQLDLKNHRGETALHRALWNNYKDLVKLLINAGADVNVQDNQGDTPLHKAATSQYNKDSLDLLLQAGAQLNTQNNQGSTPLHRALVQNNIETAKYLLRQPTINIGLKNNQGKTALDLAREKNLSEIVKILQQKEA